MAKTPVIETPVTMNDGRVVTFTGKKRLDKTVVIEGDRVGVRLDFVNGETRMFWVPPALTLQAAGHGASQKLGDSISDVADLDDAVETVDQLITRLESGEWNVRAEGSGGGMAGASILAKAMVEFTGQPISVVRGYLAGLDAKVKAQLRISAELAPIVKRLEAEKAERAVARGKAGPAVDTAAILAGISAPAQPASVFPQ